MNIIGIVTEYNPFHNGHKYQISKVKEKYKDSLIIICMSSSFTQRGELSILNKWDKTKIALNEGVDIVLELPYVYSTQSSDIFASYAVKILSNMHIDTLCFGTETKDIEKIKLSAKTQIESKEFDSLVKKYMNEGINYPTALNNALKELIDYEIKDPNDLLALSYIKEIYKSSHFINIYNIKRTNKYHDKLSNSNIVSSSNIRNKLLNKISIEDKVPNMVFNLLKDKDLSNKYFEYLKYKIISENTLDKYLDVDEGLSVRIKKYINNSFSLDELINNIKTKRYTYNKISRMLCHILCSFTKDENKEIKNLEYIRILGFTKRGQEYLNEIKKEIHIPILTKYDTQKYKALSIEKRVTEIYSNIYEDILNDEVKSIPIIKEDK